MKKRLILVIFLVFFVDLLSKFLIFKYISYGSSKIIIKDFFAIVPVKNTGAAFSILNDSKVLLILISLSVLIYLIYLSIKQKMNKTNFITYGLLIGGLLGNLFDRLFLSYVRDFFSFNIFGYDFAIFNVADIAIVIGAMLLFISMFKGSRSYEN